MHSWSLRPSVRPWAPKEKGASRTPVLMVGCDQRGERSWLGIQSGAQMKDKLYQQMCVRPCKGWKKGQQSIICFPFLTWKICNSCRSCFKNAYDQNRFLWQLWRLFLSRHLYWPDFWLDYWIRVQKPAEGRCLNPRKARMKKDRASSARRPFSSPLPGRRQWLASYQLASQQPKKKQPPEKTRFETS